MIRDHRKLIRCSSDEYHWHLFRKDPDYRYRRVQIEKEILKWVQDYGRAGARSGLIRIPVVVHVIYNTNAQNISDTQVQSQISVLNQDFRRLNADAASAPSAFASVGADARIEFALAVRDPTCNTTNGITRTYTSSAGFPYPSDDMKSAATGGHNPWNRDKYLNIWVVNVTNGYLGWSPYPGAAAAIDGVVIDYRALGNTGPNLFPKYNLGRTATHEIGHWLDLLHIWGNLGSGCADSDNVSDTPNQDDATYDCPTFPQTSCSNAPNGDMFMNFMDYVDDNCMNLFTTGQVARMDAALNTTRLMLLASDGLVPPPGSPGSDLWMKDVSEDFGMEPDTSTQPMYLSDDIWVRRQNDGLMNGDHENPEYRAPGGSSNYVYVRVRNRACSGTSSAVLKLYWAKASAGLSWPSPWDGTVTAPALMGGLIGSQSVSVAGGDDEILMFPWMPPNPADYASFGADQSHFCILARIETSSGPPYGMTFPETSNLYANVQNNNNIVWKNISIVDEVPGRGRFSVGIVANYFKKRQRITLEFLSPKGEKPSILDWGQVFIEVPVQLTKRLTKEKIKKGLRQMDDSSYQLVSNRAQLGVFDLKSNDVYAIGFRFMPNSAKPLGSRIFALDMIQKVKDDVVGGQRFIIKSRSDLGNISIDTPNTIFNGVTWVPIKDSNSCSCCCRAQLA